jgi:hypothetical protein
MRIVHVWNMRTLRIRMGGEIRWKRGRSGREEGEEKTAA